ncbi:hypothetical protein EYB45_08035 [Erythrobacteraceae bacterium CFH 75059]|uniref:hypothetical protein n=1 Tax=Qipengyuania thermophila TaxID=2509361 RepID=UPI00101EBC3D|nr:hypothetical protein [Qipengyuania thermophila]TCD05413.1 hypothetical protein EYB45_08035 [Erythrobacteraceae bacterium CFH 75059]
MLAYLFLGTPVLAALGTGAPAETGAVAASGGSEVVRAAPAPAILPRPARSAPAGALFDWHGLDRRAQQVRIEQRVIIRVVPLAPLAEQRRPASAPLRLEERRARGCIPMEQIAGVSGYGDDRMLLYLRDRRMFSVAFDRSCPVKAFYSGFYVERNGDGMLCPARDVVQARSGVRCTVGRLHRLVVQD